MTTQDTNENRPDAMIDPKNAELVAALLAALDSRDRSRGGVALTRITVADLVKKTLDSIRTDSKRTYKPYLTLLEKGWSGRDYRYEGIGKMWVDEVLPSHLEKALEAVQARAQQRHEDRHAVRSEVDRHEFAPVGSTPAYNAVGAAEAIQRCHRRKAPAQGRQPGRRHQEAHADRGHPPRPHADQLDQMWELIDSTGDDPELDRMLCETILVTGARVEGLLNMTLRHIDLDECVIWLDEKFGKVIPQPAPDWFCQKLNAFALSRGAIIKSDKVFRKLALGPKTPAAPITDRRFDYIFTQRLQAAYEWADKDQMSAHNLRHHAVTTVERGMGSKAIAQAFARHSSGVTSIYIKASREEVAAAVLRLYGGDHPWLHREPRVGPRPR
jgi:integrase